MSEIITGMAPEKETASQKKEAALQMEKHDKKIIDGKKAEFEKSSTFQAQYSACTGVIPETHMFGINDKKKQEIKAKLKLLQEEERKPVKGIFRNFETPGGVMTFPYRAYKGDPILKFELKDGQLATIPLGVARHLRHRLEYPVHGWRVNEANLATHTSVNKMVKRCTFEYIDFFDPKDEELRLQQKEYTTEPARLVI